MSMFLTCSRSIHCTVVVGGNAPKISKPIPRHFARRVFEEVVKPVVEERAVAAQRRKLCKRVVRGDFTLDVGQQLTPVESALANCIRSKLLETKLLAVCHSLPTPGRQKHLDSMRLGSKGFVVKVYNNKVMNHLIKDSSLAELRPLFNSENVLLLADRIDLLPLLSKELKPVRWLILLACVVGNRILTPKQVEEFQEKSVEHFAMQTVSLLQQPAEELRNVTQSSQKQLSSSLHHISLVNAK
uniref:Large ribosomal subunit protein uL10m n=1 Tax=Trichuris muris TaxID=70415 RepID=A0A5S6QWQ1_TRIMR